MLDFAGADAERERAERAMRGGVGIAADDGRARQRPALLGPHDMHDALADIVHGQIFDAEFVRVGFQRRDLLGDSGSVMPAARLVVGTL